jgi:superoxide dismutase, Fe-Mn family
MATTKTAIVLPPLPYERNALEPHMSRETLDYHYGKHHKAYVDKTNALMAGTEFEDASLEDLVLEASGDLFNNAAQVWNHDFFWQCLTPKAKSPGSDVIKALDEFGGLQGLREKFDKAATSLFGSGWTWLVRDAGGALKIVQTQNANTPIREGQVPLLTCDVWEHAYYIDHRNDRPAYLKDFWPLVNWEFVGKNLAQQR